MKKLGWVLLMVAMVEFLNAEDSDPSRTAMSGPCRQIAEECRKAGFEKGAKGKRLYRDCVEKILKGETVESVTVRPQTIQACQHMKKAREEAKRMNQ